MYFFSDYQTLSYLNTFVVMTYYICLIVVFHDTLFVMFVFKFPFVLIKEHDTFLK